jgi:oligoendopeptidase F
MSLTQELAPPQVRWDLSALFNSVDDPRIEQSWQEAHRAAEEFDKRYRGKINSPELAAQTLHDAIQELEELIQQAGKPVNYSHLLFACNTGDPQLGAFLQKQMEKSTELNVKLMFFELELQSVPEEVIARVIDDTALDNYRHYIQVARAFSPHRLTEAEEIILEETANTGSRAWVRFSEEMTSNHVFRLKRPGSDEEEELTEPEVLDLLRDPDRGVRQAAGDSISQGLKDLERPLVFTYNTLMGDKKVEDRLRKHPYPEHSRHLSNELDKETVDLVISMCRDNYGLVERFYTVKRQILGLPELTHVDRYAPLFEATEQVEWNTAKEICLDSFAAFSLTLKDKAAEFFTEGWIDAEPRPGKRGGAFCSYLTPDTHPVVFLSYLNKMDNVMTLAHELGHGVHASLSREQTYLNFHGTLPLAELASTFAEMLVFERVTAGASLKDKLALYAEKIEGIFATVFRQAALFRFEQRAHERRREHGELTPEEFGDIWQEELQAMFGSSIKLGEQHRSWWSYISHFVSVPFYVYAYSFGELLVLSLYQMAKEEGSSFAPKYENLLRLGGSKSPQELMQTVGVDLKSREFWQGGFDAMEKLVTQFERLWAEYQR